MQFVMHKQHNGSRELIAKQPGLEISTLLKVRELCLICIEEYFLWIVQQQEALNLHHGRLHPRHSS